MTYPHRRVSTPPMVSARTAAAAIIQRAVSREKKPGRARNRWRNCSANSDGTSSAATAFLTSCLIRARLSISRVQSAQDLKCSSTSLLVYTGSSLSSYASQYRRYVSQDRPLNLTKFISSPPGHFPSCSLKDTGPQVYSRRQRFFDRKHSMLDAGCAKPRCAGDVHDSVSRRGPHSPPWLSSLFDRR